MAYVAASRTSTPLETSALEFSVSYDRLLPYGVLDPATAAICRIGPHSPISMQLVPTNDGGSGDCPISGADEIAVSSSIRLSGP